MGLVFPEGQVEPIAGLCLHEPLVFSQLSELTCELVVYGLLFVLSIG